MDRVLRASKSIVRSMTGIVLHIEIVEQLGIDVFLAIIRKELPHPQRGESGVNLCKAILGRSDRSKGS